MREIKDNTSFRIEDEPQDGAEAVALLSRAAPDLNPLNVVMPGLDVAQGLRMCNNDSHLYLGMLHKFRMNKRDEDEKIRTLLATGDRETACRTAHNLKSVAAVIGAADLSTAARMLEVTLSHSRDEATTQLNNFSLALKLVIRSLDAALAVIEPLPEMHRRDDRQQTILIVDDTEINVKILSKVLCDEYNIVVATSGEMALEITARDSPPDLILLDVLMPGMSGYEVCAQLKADPCTATIPVIFVTGLSGESDEQTGLDLGAVDFIQKPFSPSLVRARVRNHLELQKHRSNLEKLVNVRTAELEVNNINLAKEIAIRIRTEAAMKEQAALLVEQVSERKQAQEKLQVKQQQLAELNAGLEEMVADEVRKNREKDGIMLHQDKLASIGHLAAGVAHEINNPMGFIMSNLGTLKGYVEKLGQFTSMLQTIIATDGSEEEQRMVEEVAQRLDITYILQDLGVLIAESTEGAERVKQIVLDLKDFARADQHSFKEADLNGCIRSTINIVRNEIKYVADLVLQLGNIPQVLCNPQQINQVIANLLLNAAHAIEGHGTITVCTRCDLDKVFMTVSDTGCGIPVEIRSRIFDPFFTTKEAGKGTGLGLNISYDIVKKHAGDITLESEPGVGTTFTITLPVSSFLPD